MYDEQEVRGQARYLVAERVWIVAKSRRHVMSAVSLVLPFGD